MRDDGHISAGFSVAVRTYGQLSSVIGCLGRKSWDMPLVRVLVDSDLYLGDGGARSLIRKAGGEGADGTGPEWVLSLPAVLRASDREYLAEVLEAVRSSGTITGIMTGNLEGLGFLLEEGFSGALYADADLYLWNSGAAALWGETLRGACLPLELKAGEQRELMRKTSLSWEKIVYGRIPMMVAANCLAKTTDRCRREDADRRDGEVLRLRDRLGKEFPVLLNCRHCYNTIYNSVPLSFHREIGRWADRAVLRLQFTIEDGRETAACLDFFLSGGGGAQNPPFGEYTTGHEKRGVE